MKRTLIITLAIVFLFASVTYAWMTGKAGHEKYLYPVVRIEAGQGIGSGTIIYSELNKEGTYSTYVLTNHHVIAEAIEITDEWNTDSGKNEKVERRRHVFVEMFKYRNMSESIGALKVKADIVIYSDYKKSEDMALLKLRTEDKAAFIVKLLPKDKVDSYHDFDPVVAVGCSRGFNPMPSEGLISFRKLSYKTFDFDMATAQIAAGNSGGAMFLAETAELIGIPSMVVLSGNFYGGAIEHMGIFIPIKRVYAFLEREDYSFLVDPTVTEEEGLAAREKRLCDVKDKDKDKGKE